MKKIFSILVLVVLFTNVLVSQSKDLCQDFRDTVYAVQLKTKKISINTYRDDSGKIKSFTAKMLDANNFNIEYNYWSKGNWSNGFLNGMLKVELTAVLRLGPSTNSTYCKTDGIGIIDTIGNIVVPCVYYDVNFLSTNENTPDEFKYFIFIKNNTIGILNAKGKVLYSFKRNFVTIIDEKFNDELRVYDYQIITNKDYSHYFAYSYNEDKVGLVSLLKSEQILPPIYDKIDVYTNYAICTKNDSVFAFDLKTEKMSKAYKGIWLSNDLKVFIVQNMDDYRFFACNDVFDVTNSLNYTFNRDFMAYYFNKKMIVFEMGKCGVINTEGQPIIPFKYDDIYFMDINNDDYLDVKYYWVKKDGFWAISNNKDSLLTDFVFVDVEKYNQINFDNMMYYAKPDTSKSVYDKSYYNYKIKRNYNRGQDILNVKGRELALKINTHVIDIQNNDYITAKKKDGFHIVKFIYKSDYKGGELLAGVITSSEAWDNIYMFSGIRMENLVGVKLGDKYGYIKLTEDDHLGKNIIYDGLVYLPKLYGNRDFNPCGVIKKNKAYYFKDRWVNGRFYYKPKKYK